MIKPPTMDITSTVADGATPAETLEHMQWLNSPLTRKLLRLLSEEGAQRMRLVKAAAFDPSTDERQVRSYAAIAWHCDRIAEVINRLPGISSVNEL